MSAPGIDGLVAVERHDRIDSTNDRIRMLAREGAPPFVAVLAREQTSGRGRGSREWHSPRDAGLWVSVLLPAPPGGLPGVVSLVLGVAAARAVARAGGVGVGLKWPNDLIAVAGQGTPGPGKLGGVLCEAVRGPAGMLAAAGVGVNLRRHGPLPDDMRGACFLDEVAGCRIEAADLLAALAEELREVADPPPNLLDDHLLEEWRRRDILVGHRVHSSMAPPGIALGPAPDGALRVADASGHVHRVRAGTVRIEGEGSPALFAVAGEG